MILSEGVTTAASPNDEPPDTLDDPDDRGYGTLMFFVFTAAVLVVTCAVCVLAVVGSWWMLGLAVGVHVGLTAAVTRVVLGAFGPDGDRYPDLAPPNVVAAKRTVELAGRRAAVVTHH